MLLLSLFKLLVSGLLLLLFLIKFSIHRPFDFFVLVELYVIGIFLFKIVEQILLSPAERFFGLPFIVPFVTDFLARIDFPLFTPFMSLFFRLFLVRYDGLACLLLSVLFLLDDIVNKLFDFLVLFLIYLFISLCLYNLFDLLVLPLDSLQIKLLTVLDASSAYFLLVVFPVNIRPGTD